MSGWLDKPTQVERAKRLHAEFYVAFRDLPDKYMASNRAAKLLSVHNLLRGKISQRNIRAALSYYRREDAPVAVVYGRPDGMWIGCGYPRLVTDRPRPRVSVPAYPYPVEPVETPKAVGEGIAIKDTVDGDGYSLHDLPKPDNPNIHYPDPDPYNAGSVKADERYPDLVRVRPEDDYRGRQFWRYDPFDYL